MAIHISAIISPSASIAPTAEVGPYCVIGPNVVLGESCTLLSHVVIDGHCTVGSGNTFYPFCSLGQAPQDLKYKGEPTRLEIGNDNTFREGVTVSLGTVGGGGITRIGNSCLLMAYAHVGHDCLIGNNCILPNGATLAGHVTVEDFASLSALGAIHQHCRVGKHAYMGGGTTITQDVLPYSLTSAARDVNSFSINKLGLERRGCSQEELRILRRAFASLSAKSGLNTSQAIEAIEAEGLDSDSNVEYLVKFIRSSHRGVIR